MRAPVVSEHNSAPSASDLAARLNARFRAPLMSFFLRRTGSRQDAEDLTQEVFLCILRRGEELPSEYAEVFIFKIAANLLRDRARHAGARRGLEHVSLDGADHPDPASGRVAPGLIEDLEPERVLLSQEALAAALRALDELGERTRDIFVLYRLEKMKQREIAGLYGISVSSVEKYVARATEHLALVFGPL
ncbi:MAG: RNA polymerase sigma factor [Ignavibacteriales bacterium]